MRTPLFRPAWRALTSPRQGFQGPAPTLGRAVADLLWVWVPLALVNAALTCWRTLHSYEGLRRDGPPTWLLPALGLEPQELKALLQTLPAAPLITQVLPWLLVLVPLGLLGTWLHHAVWDHTGLWLLGGLKTRRGFRTSLIAEAEALRFAALGTLVGLLGFLPVVGLFLGPPLLLLDGYLWLFRGFALAARHGCEPWRGVAATVLHAVLLGGCALGLGMVLLILVRVGG